MDFSKYKVMFDNWLRRTQRTSKTYLNLYDSNEKTTSLVSSTNQTIPILSTISTVFAEPSIESVPRESWEQSEALEIIQLSDLEIQQEALKLKDILGCNVSEATIHSLLQSHSTG